MSNIHAAFNLNFANTGTRAFGMAIDITVPGTGITAIFGPSGSGKTTLLRCIAGLYRATGTVNVNGTVWQDEGVFIPTHRRPLGYVFQDANLFSHLNVRGNLAYASKRAQSPVTASRHARILEVLGIENLLDQPATSLSGGEQQRVAIARALLINPELLLMDEPLASLDIARRQEILPYLEAMHAEFNLPVLYVSHAVDEVSRLADHVVVLEAGRVTAEGEVVELLAHLNTPLQSADDAGVIVNARITERDEKWHLIRAEFAGGAIWLTDNGEAVGTDVRIRIMARDVSLAASEHADTSILNRLPARVSGIREDPHGPTCLVQLAIGNEHLLARVTRRSVAHLNLEVGTTVWVQVKSAAVAH